MAAAMEMLLEDWKTETYTYLTRECPDIKVCSELFPHKMGKKWYGAADACQDSIGVRHLLLMANKIKSLLCKGASSSKEQT